MESKRLTVDDWNNIDRVPSKRISVSDWILAAKRTKELEHMTAHQRKLDAMLQYNQMASKRGHMKKNIKKSGKKKPLMFFQGVRSMDLSRTA